MPKNKPSESVELDEKTEPEPTDLVKVPFHGIEFTIPRAADDWPTPAYLARLEAISTGRLNDWMKFIELLLGEHQWRRLTSSAAPRAGDFKQFISVLGDVVQKECVL